MSTSYDPIPRLSTEQVRVLLERAQNSENQLHELFDVLNRSGDLTELSLTAEWLDGWLAAIACNRNPVEYDQWLLLYFEDNENCFANEQDAALFKQTCLERIDVFKAILLTDPQDYEGQLILQPYVLDMPTAVRDSLAQETPGSEAHQELSAIERDQMPSIAQQWAQGFLGFVELFEQDWKPPKDKELARALPDLMELMQALEEDDDQPWTEKLDDDSEPSLSEERVNAVADAMTACHELRLLWAYAGPHVEQVIGSKKVGPNEPCPCGSGKKFKKCHGL